MIAEIFPGKSMSIDLSSNTSPFDLEKMLPLDVLAAVASQTLRNEICSISNKEKSLNESKRQLKKPNFSSDLMTLEEVKALPSKSLVEKFSEMTSDELTKKYSYKCLLLPDKCCITYKSFGNEKKAFDKMKDHLLGHIRQLRDESESGGYANKLCSRHFFYSKCTEKSPKRNLKLPKKQHILLGEILPKSGSHKVFKTGKKSTYVVNKLRKKFSKSFSTIDQQFHLGMKSYSNEKRINKKFSFDTKGLKNKKSPQKSIPSYKKLNNSQSISSPEESNSSNYNMFTPSENESSKDIKKNVTSNILCFADVSQYPSYKNECDDHKSSSSSNEKPTIYLHDHTYAAADELKKNEKLSHESRRNAFETRKKTARGTKRCVIPPQFIIKTPPFPFVHTPLLPDVAEIKEISMEEVYYAKNMLHRQKEINCVNTRTKSKSKNNEKLLDDENKYDSVTGSVLECVENRVNMKQSSTTSPKNSFSSAENDENLENMQRFERELALKYIAKLYARKKKQNNGSLICQICKDKYFTAQATLIHHYRSHAGIKPYICNICSSTFTRQHSLNYHMLIHQNLSRFTCAHCGRTFRHPSHYKEHLRRHTGEAPFHCRDCNLHFKTRNTFKRHLRTRHQKLLTSHGLTDIPSDSSP